MPKAIVSHHPAILHKLTRLRSQDTEPYTFRALVQELAFLLAVEATGDLAMQTLEVQTPLAPCLGSEIAESIALVPILRAALGMAEGVLPLFPQAAVRHLGFYRDEIKLKPVPYYNKLPSGPAEDLCIVLDPMVATGGSAVAAIQAVKNWGPKRIKFLGILGAPEGVEIIHEAHPDVPLYLCGLDERLDERGYILPGLGDAGDRLFNT
jgi:uracil phosphoribosyltransferase